MRQQGAWDCIFLSAELPGPRRAQPGSSEPWLSVAATPRTTLGARSSRLPSLVSSATPFSIAERRTLALDICTCFLIGVELLHMHLNFAMKRLGKPARKRTCSEDL